MQPVYTTPTQTVPLLPLRLLIAFFRDPLRMPLQLAHQYGDAFSFQVGKQRIIVLNHPDAIRELLVVQHEHIRKGDGVMQRDNVLGRGLATNDGPFYKKQRRLVQPAFHRQRLTGYAQTMVEAALQQAWTWCDGTTIDMVQEMPHLTLEIVAKTLFNADMGEETRVIEEGLPVTLEEFRKNALSLRALLGKDLLRRLPFPINIRSKRACARMDQVIARMIDEHRQKGDDQGDLLSMLLLAQDEEGHGMSDRQLRDEVMTLMTAGHETVAFTLIWTWYLLAVNPEAKAKVQLEVDRVLSGRAATFDDLPHLDYTRRVIMETMRLYPPVWIMDRRTLSDLTLAGISIPAGARVVVSQYVVHHDPRFYPDPDRFDPDRWTPERQASRPKFAYFPFGGGPRICIGESFALTECILLLATLSQHWQIELSPKACVELQPSVILRPKYGIEMILHQRGKVPSVANGS